MSLTGNQSPNGKAVNDRAATNTGFQQVTSPPRCCSEPFQGRNHCFRTEYRAGAKPPLRFPDYILFFLLYCAIHTRKILPQHRDGTNEPAVKIHRRKGRLNVSQAILHPTRGRPDARSSQPLRFSSLRLALLWRGLSRTRTVPTTIRLHPSNTSSSSSEKTAASTTSSPPMFRRPGETVNNLLSEGIVKLTERNAIPGPNFDKAQQLAATDSTPDTFLLSPHKTEFPNNQLPAPLVGGPSVSYVPNACAAGTPESQCAASLTLAQESENGLASNYYSSLLIGGSGLPAENAGHSNYEREYSASWSLSVDQWQQLRVHGLRSEPGPSLLSDVAAAELQRGPRELGESFRLQRQALLLG